MRTLTCLLSQILSMRWLHKFKRDDSSFEDAPIYYVNHDKMTESFAKEELSVEDLDLLKTLIKAE